MAQSATELESEMSAQLAALNLDPNLPANEVAAAAAQVAVDVCGDDFTATSLARRDVFGAAMAAFIAGTIPATAEPPPTTGGYSVTPAETAHWADKAALLDPDCYVFQEGANWSLTVPTGKTWYMINAWALRKPAAPFQNYKWHHRPLDSEQAIPMPAGFTFKADDFGYAYYADPSIVQAGDQRYQDDPRGLYYERLERLKTLPLEEVCAHIPAGTSINNSFLLASFPTSAERILITHIDCHDGCWIILQSGDLNNITSALNTQMELDDVRPQRVTSSVLAPIKRSVHPHIRLGTGTLPGGTGQSYDGWGSVKFVQLPSDW